MLVSPPGVVDADEVGPPVALDDVPEDAVALAPLEGWPVPVAVDVELADALDESLGPSTWTLTVMSTRNPADGEDEEHPHHEQTHERTPGGRGEASHQRWSAFPASEVVGA